MLFQKYVSNCSIFISFSSIRSMICFGISRQAKVFLQALKRLINMIRTCTDMCLVSILETYWKKLSHHDWQTGTLSNIAWPNSVGIGFSNPVRNGYKFGEQRISDTKSWIIAWHSLLISPSQFRSLHRLKFHHSRF